MRRLWANPETREHLTDEIRERLISEKVRRKIGEAVRRRWTDPAVREAHSERMRTLWAGDFGAAMRARAATDEWRAGCAERARKVWENPENRERLAAKVRGFLHSEETKQRIGEASRERMKDPVLRAKLAAANRARAKPKPPPKVRKPPPSRLGCHHSEETKRRISETQRGRVFSDETRAKMRAAGIARWQRQTAAS